MATIINPNDQTLLTAKSMATSFTSAWIPLIRNVSYYFEAQWTGSPVGNFNLQVSGDSAANINVTPTSTPVVLPTTVSPAGGATGSLGIAYEDAGAVPYNWVQFAYIATSGTGTLTSLKLNGK